MREQAVCRWFTLRVKIAALDFHGYVLTLSDEAPAVGLSNAD